MVSLRFLVERRLVKAVDQVWALGDRYPLHPVREGFRYLAAVVDLFSPTRSQGEHSNSVGTLQMALNHDRKPEIFESDKLAS